jgi:hypothetical protein
VLAYKFKSNSSPLALTEADSRVSQFMKCSMALVDLFQRDYELSAMERACMDSYLHLIELSYNSWKRRTDRLSLHERPAASSGRSDRGRGGLRCLFL